MPEEIKYMDLKEFREGGYLQEANRRFFHPLGLALEVAIAEDGTETLGQVWDYREDPKGMNFGPGMIDHEKREKISDEWMAKYTSRHRILGYFIQVD